jgi:hypothetical protein
VSVGARGRAEVQVVFAGHGRHPVGALRRPTDVWGARDSSRPFGTHLFQLRAESANLEIAFFHFPIINVRWLNVQGQQHIPSKVKRCTLQPRNARPFNFAWVIDPHLRLRLHLTRGDSLVSVQVPAFRQTLTNHNRHVQVRQSDGLGRFSSRGFWTSRVPFSPAMALALR